MVGSPFNQKPETLELSSIIYKGVNKMCTVCAHPLRLEIERDLLSCPSAAAVAACHHLPLEDVKKHKTRLQARIEHRPAAVRADPVGG